MTYTASNINPFYSSTLQRRPKLETPPERKPLSRLTDRDPTRWARLPAAPVTGSPVPGLTSLYHSAEAGHYGDRGYPGNCGGNLIRDLVRYFRAKSVFDPMTGSGTCRDVCKELDVYCWSSDLHQGVDACEPGDRPAGAFDLAWIHPPYWRMKLYTQDPRDLSRTATMGQFLDRYRLLIANCAGAIAPGGKVAILMGDYSDKSAGYVPLVYHTKELAFSLGLKQHCTDIIRFSHGNSSSKKVYRSSFIPGLHDVCTIFEKAN